MPIFKKLNEYAHKPVLLNEVLNGLELRPDGCYVDCTFGRGGHSRAILQRLDDQGRLFAFDKDPEAVRFAQNEFSCDGRFTCVHGSFTGLGKVVAQNNLHGAIDGLLFDLGVSSPQLDDPSRGFSFLKDGLLDMRMNPNEGSSAADWLNHASESELAAVLRNFGEERYTGRIARAIAGLRSTMPVTSTRQLAELIKAAVPAVERDKHPATRSFQAIRIHVNNELSELREVLAQVAGVLRTGGRLAVISFHSGEDRIVKRFIREQSAPDPYPKYLPVSNSGIKPKMKAVGRAIKPGKREIETNPRGRSAVLRIAEKLAP